MLPPGAATAGLKNRSLEGPKDENEDMRPPAASGNAKEPPDCGNEMETFSPAAKAFASWKISLRQSAWKYGPD